MKTIPVAIRNMKYSQMIKMNYTLHSLIKEHKNNLSFVFDFNNLKWIDPSGAVIFLETIKNLKEESIKLEYIDLDLTLSPIQYGLNIGVFQLLGISQLSSNEEGPTYLSPKKVYKSKVYEYIENHNYTIESFFDILSKKITDKVIRQSNMTNDKLFRLFNYVVRELIRNIFDHSESEYFYYGSQYLPNKKIVELVISDRGLGLKNTIPFNEEERWYNLNTTENAINKAFTPGITAESNHSYAPENYWNSGFGLAMVRNLISAADGTLSLATSDKSVTYDSTDSWCDCNIQGTIIRLRVDLEKLILIDFEEQLNKVVCEAKLIDKSFIPSKKSQTL